MQDAGMIKRAASDVFNKRRLLVRVQQLLFSCWGGGNYGRQQKAKAVRIAGQGEQQTTTPQTHRICILILTQLSTLKPRPPPSTLSTPTPPPPSTPRRALVHDDINAFRILRDIRPLTSVLLKNHEHRWVYRQQIRSTVNHVPQARTNRKRR